jgi:hypothetical protein
MDLSPSSYPKAMEQQTVSVAKAGAKLGGAHMACPEFRQENRD